MQGSFSVWTDHKKGHTKVKDLARFKPMQRHLFLHEKAVLFCKKREENGEGYEKAPSYSYKQSLNVSEAPSPQLLTLRGERATSRGSSSCSHAAHHSYLQVWESGTPGILSPHPKTASSILTMHRPL